MTPYTEEENLASKGYLFSFSLFAVIQLYWVFSKDLLLPHKTRGNVSSCKDIISWRLLWVVSSLILNVEHNLLW